MSTFRTLPIPDPFALSRNAHGAALIAAETGAVLAMGGWFTAAEVAPFLRISVARASLRLQAMERSGQLEKRHAGSMCRRRYEYRRMQ